MAAQVVSEVQTPFGRLQLFSDGKQMLHPDDKAMDTAKKMPLKRKYRGG